MAKVTGVNQSTLAATYASINHRHTVPHQIAFVERAICHDAIGLYSLRKRTDPTARVAQ